MIIRTLEMTNFRGIASASFSFHPRLNVFAGVNGVGKSSVLDCLSILLSRVTGRVVSGNGGRMFSKEDISNDASETVCSITVGHEGADYGWRLGRSVKLEKSASPSEHLADARRIASEVRSRLDDDPSSNVPLAAFYATNRAVVQVPLKVKKQHAFDQIAALEDALLSERRESDFRLFFEWFRNREDEENERYRRCVPGGSSPEPDVMLQAVRTAVERLMPGYSGLQVRRRPKLCMVVEKDGVTFRIESLSDGEKCLLALVADMARRLAMANPSMSDPLGAEAVFLIDEVDLHLHPSWQRTVVPGLLEVFPHCQFFISTHSPLVLGEIRDMESIWIMTPDAAPFHPPRAYGLDANEVLGEIMDAKSRSTEIQDEIDGIDALIRNDEFGKARKAIRGLVRKTGVIPAIFGLNAMLTMFGEDPAELDDIGVDS